MSDILAAAPRRPVIPEQPVSYKRYAIVFFLTCLFVEIVKVATVYFLDWPYPSGFSVIAVMLGCGVLQGCVFTHDQQRRPSKPEKRRLALIDIACALIVSALLILFICLTAPAERMAEINELFAVIAGMPGTMIVVSVLLMGLAYLMAGVGIGVGADIVAKYLEHKADRW